MHLNNCQLNELCQLAAHAATMAGQMIAQRSKEKFKISSKTVGSSLASQVLTEVDIASEQLILKALNATLKQYDLALLSEETPDDQQRFEKDYFWCIDPLDGTLPFTEQQPGYAVSIALVAKDGTSQIGVIYDPTTSNLYTAINGSGAFKNDKPLKINSNQKAITLVCDRSFLHDQRFEQVKSKLSALSDNKLNTISHGGAAMNAIWVLENHPAVYFKFPKKQAGGGSLWDYAASNCIFNELSAPSTDYEGKQLKLNRKDTTFMNKEGIFYCSCTRLSNTIKEAILQLDQ